MMLNNLDDAKRALLVALDEGESVVLRNWEEMVDDISRKQLSIEIEEKEQQDTAIIAFDLSQDKNVISILPDGEGAVQADDLHMTLLFLGTVDRLDKDLILQKLALMSTMQAPIEGNFTGYGIFNPSEHSGDTIPVVLLYDSPQLPVLHDNLREIFNDERIPTHGFIPHVTLAYADKPLDYQKYNKNKIFDQISLWWGEEHYAYNLSGNTVEKGGPGSGHHGHSGRPGKRGGSGPGGGKGFSGNIVFRNIGPEARAEFGGDISVNAVKWVAMNAATKRFVVAHEIAHHTVEDYILKNNTEWDLAENVLTLDVLHDGRKLYLGGNTRIGEAISDVIGSRLINDTVPQSTLETYNWANNVILRAGYDVDKLIFDVDRIYNVIESAATDNKQLEEKQLPIDEGSVRNLIEIRTNIFYAESDELMRQLFTGEITIGQAEESMKQLIRGLTTSTAAIGKGGWENMTAADWGRLGTPLREQYRYLHGFMEYISNNRDTVSLEALQARARLYGKAAGHAAILMQAGPDIASQLPWLPKDGSTECLIGCHCLWLLTILNTLADGTRVVQAIWRIRPAEHCQDCISRNNHVEIINVPAGVDIPSTIGGF